MTRVCVLILCKLMHLKHIQYLPDIVDRFAYDLLVVMGEITKTQAQVQMTLFPTCILTLKVPVHQNRILQR